MKRRRQSNRRKVNMNRQVSSVARRKRGVPQTAAEFFERSERFQDQWIRITHAISKMRKVTFSLREASREFGLNPRTVLRWGKTALRKSASGRYVAKKYDRLLRILVVLTQGGTREIAVRDSRHATLVAEHWNAVNRYLETGDASRLVQFEGKFVVDASGAEIPLLTDLAELDRLASAGVFSFETIYARSA